jgi:hypothetical protein
MTDDSQIPAELEEAFMEAWNLYENYFTQLSEDSDWYKQLLSLVIELRKMGYDRKTRPGSSVSTFVLSRSIKYGLRLEQPYLAIAARPGEGMRVRFYELGENPETMQFGVPPKPYPVTSIAAELHFNEVKLTVELEELLERLLAHPID